MLDESFIIKNIKSIEQGEVINRINKCANPKVRKLFVAGKIEKTDFQRAIAVIGSRKMTRYGEDSCKTLVRGLVKHGFTIVSGLMYGVDIVAHKTALESGGRTIAVLGYGFRHLLKIGYASKIAGEILNNKQGAILTELEFVEPPSKWTFPKRNRIVAGLADSILVVEAGERSGSFITVDYAIDEGKDIFAVPGNIFGHCSLGTNKLIKDGAFLVDSVKDILDRYGVDEEISDNKALSFKGLSVIETSVLKLIELEPEGISTDLIINNLKLAPDKIYPILTNLEYNGRISKDYLGKWLLMRP